MKRTFVQSHQFSHLLDTMISSGKLLEEDFENLEKDLLNDSKFGEVIPGLNGLRKIRLKSSTKGKRGGFRVDYLDIPEAGLTIFLILYAKNVKSDLSSNEKKAIAQKVLKIKEEAKKRG